MALNGSQPGLQQYSGRYHLDYVKVNDPSDQPIDITNLVGEINVDASIVDPTIIVRILVNDAQNILSTLPVKGGSDVRVMLSFADSQTEYFLKIAEIVSLTNFEQQRAYQIVCISRFAFASGFQRISRSYTGPVSAIAAAVFSEYSPDPTGLWDQSIGKQTLVIPNWSPIKTLTWLASRARPSDDDVHFRFYQDSQGRYNFVPIERAITIYGQSTVASYTYFKNVTREFTGNGNERPVTREDMFSIQDIKYGAGGRVFNIMEAFKHNMLSGRMTTSNLFDGTYKEQYYDYFAQFDPNKYANPQPQYRRTQYYPTNIMINALSTNTTSLRGYNENNDISDIKRTTLNDYTQRLEITVKGNNVVNIGQLIDVTVPAPKPNTQTGEEKRDIYWSGNYYVVGIRDRYNRQEKTSVIELIKESLLNGASV